MTRTKTSTKRFTSYFTGRNLPKFLLPGLLFTGTVLLILAASFIDWTPLLQPIQDFVSQIEEPFKQSLDQKSGNNNPLFLILVAFAGGLIGSISPCHLGLLTVNLTYIGTREFTSRRDAFIKGGSFVLG